MDLIKFTIKRYFLTIIIILLLIVATYLSINEDFMISFLSNVLSMIIAGIILSYIIIGWLDTINKPDIRVIQDKINLTDKGGNQYRITLGIRNLGRKSIDKTFFWNLLINKDLHPQILNELTSATKGEVVKDGVFKIDEQEYQRFRGSSTEIVYINRRNELINFEIKPINGIKQYIWRFYLDTQYGEYPRGSLDKKGDVILSKTGIIDINLL